MLETRLTHAKCSTLSWCMGFPAKWQAIQENTRNPEQLNQRIQEPMRTYQETLDAVVRYFEKHGKTQDIIDKVETMLPGAWAMNLIADALDILTARNK